MFIKDVFFPFVLIVIQPLRGAVLLHSLYCNTSGRVSGTAFRAGADIPTSEIMYGCFLSLCIDCDSASPWCCSFTFSMLLHTQTVIIDQKCIDDLLPGVQHLYARFVAQRRHITLIESLSTETEKDLQTLARLRSSSYRAASLWLDTLPMSAHLQLSDAEFRSAMRHRLGLTHTPANVGAVQCWCGRHSEPGDTSHAMTC